MESSQLRKVLGDGKNEASIVQTVHKRGDRFTPAARKIVCDTSRLSDIANEAQTDVILAGNQSEAAGHPPAGLSHSQVALTGIGLSVNRFIRPF
jgi:DNA-binding winged helix-turn-helix (wHTH) protein